jgi:hypothetical protein
MQQNRKSLLESIEPAASAFVQEGNPKIKQEKKKKLEEVQPVEEQEHKVPFNNGTAPLKPVTFMLSTDLVDEIMMLSATRKIIKKKPYSQKDILTEALRDWINKNK